MADTERKVCNTCGGSGEVGYFAGESRFFITREELSVLLDINDTGSGVGAGKVDRRSIRRVIRFADTTVGQAMIPLADVIGFNEMRSTADAVQTVIRHGFNRLPVYRGNITKVNTIVDSITNRLNRVNVISYYFYLIIVSL